jgi:hypothetical protein
MTETQSTRRRQIGRREIFWLVLVCAAVYIVGMLAAGNIVATFGPAICGDSVSGACQDVAEIKASLQRTNDNLGAVSGR